MASRKYPDDPVALNVAARYLGVPSKWLRTEVEAKRIPALVADSRVLVHVPTAAALIAERAKRGEVDRAN
jgi:hypothetical protein